MSVGSSRKFLYAEQSEQGNEIKEMEERQDCSGPQGQACEQMSLGITGTECVEDRVQEEKGRNWETQ